MADIYNIVIEVITVTNNKTDPPKINFINYKLQLANDSKQILKPTNKKRLMTPLHKEGQHFDLIFQEDEKESLTDSLKENKNKNSESDKTGDQYDESEKRIIIVRPPKPMTKVQLNCRKVLM